MPNYLIISKKRSEAQPLSKTIILTKLEFLVTRVITSTCSRNFFFEEKEKYLLSIIISIRVQIQVLVLEVALKLVKEIHFHFCATTQPRKKV